VNNINLIKHSYDIPTALASCHTAVVGDYLVEGHVSAEDIVQLLKQKPAIKGIAGPGMPIGSPGMEGGKPEAYDVVSFGADVEEVMFMGGSGIYAEALSHANRLYLTEVYAEVSGDVYFPEFGRDEWVELEREDHSADEKNDHDYSFVVLERV
jgi:hypothetical protein